MWWDAPHGPSVNLTITYNSLDSLIDVRPFGEKWTFAYASYLMVEPGGGVMVVRGGAKGERYTPDGNGGYLSDARNATRTMRRIAGHDYRFELEEGDGTVYLYDVPPAMQGQSASSLLLSITDKYGTAVTVTHNSQGAVTAVSHPAAATSLDPTGTWNLVYNGSGKVIRIDDPFGRQCTYSYAVQGGKTVLTGQTDMGGVAYSYGYTTAGLALMPDPGDPEEVVLHTDELFLDTLTTPSGTTSFYTEPADGVEIEEDIYPAPGDPMWESYRITVTDPMGFQEEWFYSGSFYPDFRDSAARKK